jgi:hypothetical protein
VIGEPSVDLVYVNQSYSVRQSQEPGVLIGERQYQRFIERLDDCKEHGWSELWLAAAGIAAGVAATAAISSATLPAGKLSSATRGDLKVAAISGLVVLAVCLIAYLTHRQDHGREVDHLMKDLRMYSPRPSIRKPSALPRSKHTKGEHGPGTSQ